jgi:hypothetical protein
VNLLINRALNQELKELQQNMTSNTEAVKVVKVEGQCYAVLYNCTHTQMIDEIAFKLSKEHSCLECLYKQSQIELNKQREIIQKFKKWSGLMRKKWTDHRDCCPHL